MTESFTVPTAHALDGNRLVGEGDMRKQNERPKAVRQEHVRPCIVLKPHNWAHNLAEPGNQKFLTQGEQTYRWLDESKANVTNLGFANPMSKSKKDEKIVDI